MTRRLLTPAEFAKQTQLDYKTVLKHVKCNNIHSVLVGKRRRIPSEWVTKWIRGSSDSTEPTEGELMTEIATALIKKIHEGEPHELRQAL